MSIAAQPDRPDEPRTKPGPPHPAWEEFRSKWLTSVFDKVVLGIAVAAALAFIQARLADQQKQAEIVRQAAANVANVSSGLLSDERKALSDRVAEFIGALAKTDDRSNTLAFSRSLVAVESQVWKAEAVFHGLWPKDPVDFNPFRKVLFDLDHEWFQAIRQAAGGDQHAWGLLIAKFQENYRRRISEAYVDLVRAMQVAIVDAAKSDARLAIKPDQDK